MHRGLRLLTLLAGLVVLGTPSRADVVVDLHRFDPGGRVEAARAVDLDRDGRLDLVLLVTSQEEEKGERPELVLLRLPKGPPTTEGPTRWEEAGIRRIPLDEGVAAGAGAVAVGRFGPNGEARIRLLTVTGIHDLRQNGEEIPQTERQRTPGLIGRSAGRRLCFWDGHADLDGDGIEECWFPGAAGSGRVRILGGTPSGDRSLSLAVFNRCATDDEYLFIRYARVPRLLPADLDGDGMLELVAWDGQALVAWSIAGGEEPAWRVPLPFARPDLGPDEIHTPRIQLKDIDGDHVADLLVTVVTGTRTHVDSFRTRLHYFPGPFYDPKTRRLVRARGHIDTQSVALHPRFIDLDGDGALDYVSDSILSTNADLLRRILGQDPTIWHKAYLYDAVRGTFEAEPSFSMKRPYSREEAVSNRFGISAFFSGDYDGDGLKDMLDLGNLNGFEILGALRKRGEGPGDPITFARRLLARQPVKTPLTADALIADLDGNGLADAAVWNERGFFLMLFRSVP